MKKMLLAVAVGFCLSLPSVAFSDEAELSTLSIEAELAALSIEPKKGESPALSIERKKGNLVADVKKVVSDYPEFTDFTQGLKRLIEQVKKDAILKQQEGSFAVMLQYEPAAYQLLHEHKVIATLTEIFKSQALTMVADDAQHQITLMLAFDTAMVNSLCQAEDEALTKQPNSFEDFVKAQETFVNDMDKQVRSLDKTTTINFMAAEQLGQFFMMPLIMLAQFEQLSSMFFGDVQQQALGNYKTLTVGLKDQKGRSLTDASATIKGLIETVIALRTKMHGDEERGKSFAQTLHGLEKIIVDYQSQIV